MNRARNKDTIKSERVEQETSNGHGSGTIEVNLYLRKSVQRLKFVSIYLRFMCFDFTKVYLWGPNDAIFFAQCQMSAWFWCTFTECEGPISFDLLNKSFIFHQNFCRVQMNHSYICHMCVIASSDVICYLQPSLISCFSKSSLYTSSNSGDIVQLQNESYFLPVRQTTRHTHTMLLFAYKCHVIS